MMLLSHKDIGASGQCQGMTGNMPPSYSQAEGREFQPRRPLHNSESLTLRLVCSNDWLLLPGPHL